MKSIWLNSVKSVLFILVTIFPFIYQQSRKFPHFSPSSQLIIKPNHSQSSNDPLPCSISNHSEQKISGATTFSSIETNLPYSTSTIDCWFFPICTSTKLHLSRFNWVIFNNLSVMDLRLIFNASSPPGSVTATFLPLVFVVRIHMEVQLITEYTWTMHEDIKSQISTNIVVDTTAYIDELNNCTRSVHLLKSGANSYKIIKLGIRLTTMFIYPKTKVTKHPRTNFQCIQYSDWKTVGLAVTTMAPLLISSSQTLSTYVFTIIFVFNTLPPLSYGICSWILDQ